MVEAIGEGNFNVNFIPNVVGDHHQLLADRLDGSKVVWFGIIPKPAVAYDAPPHGAHPAFTDGSRYGPFSFEIKVNTAFERYCQITNIEGFQNLFFYRVDEDIYPRERSVIIVVSAVAITGLTAFIPDADSVPCVRQQNNDGINWEWECEDFDAYQNNVTKIYFQLEFLFVFPAGLEGEFPNFTFVVGDAANDGIDCLAKSNFHENASICIPFQNRWDDVRKSLTCIMVANRSGGRSKVRQRNYDQALARHGLKRFDGWAGVNEAICNAGGCNNPSFVTERAGNGVQTKAFADEKLAYIFA